MTAMREVPLTPDEVRARNRVYQQNRRDRSNNAYARAYRRATQRLVAWAQQAPAYTFAEIVRLRALASLPLADTPAKETKT